MKHFILSLLRISALTLSLLAMVVSASCRQDDLGLGGEVDFSLLFDCMWVPELRDNIPETDEIPFVALDPDYPVYFSKDGTKLEILHRTGDKYSAYMTYNALIDKTTSVVMLEAEGEQTYWARIDKLNVRYLTVYFGNDENNYVIYKREKLPSELSIGKVR